jgi:hypothetical protein
VRQLGAFVFLDRIVACHRIGEVSARATSLRADESVQTHSLRSFLFGQVEEADPQKMREQWQKTIELLMGLSSSMNEKGKGWTIEEVEVGLTLSVKGELLFIAEAGAEASVKIKLTKK